MHIPLRVRGGQSFRRFCFYAGSLVLAALVLGAGSPAGAATSKKHDPDFSKGALYGKVIDAATGKPVQDATVAILGTNGKPVIWTRTNAEGKYALAADTFAVLHLRPSQRRGLLEEVCRGAGNIAMAPVRVVVGVVSRPGETAKSAVEATIMGNPMPIAAQIAGALTDKAKAAPANAELSARQAACIEVFSERPAPPKSKKPGISPGELSLAVTAPGFKDLRAAACAYWMEPAIDAKPAPKLGVQAWIETVKLAPKLAADKKSEVAKESLLLADPVVEPTLAPAGATLHLAVRLNNPLGFGPKVRIFAREKKKDTVAELRASDPKTPDLFTGDLALDKSLAAGDTQIAIGVLRTEPLEVKIPKAKTDPLLRFAGRIGELEAGKPFAYDPRIFACENRMDLSVTVLDPKQAPRSASVVPLPPGRSVPAATTVPPVPSPPARGAVEAVLHVPPGSDPHAATPPAAPPDNTGSTKR